MRLKGLWLLRFLLPLWNVGRVIGSIQVSLLMRTFVSHLSWSRGRSTSARAFLSHRGSLKGFGQSAVSVVFAH